MNDKHEVLRSANMQIGEVIENGPYRVLSKVPTMPLQLICGQLTIFYIQIRNLTSFINMITASLDLSRISRSLLLLGRYSQKDQARDKSFGPLSHCQLCFASV
ncbi:hypothetical protein CEXT_130771 [Caerostris extrusa]|uniref:Uncharacterized protein n=1 Tax=Caerostris extrusa TaxID=172846 RepID=A0AAV4VG81_CAEEX|nr:hypothetical protein CEXT_130771 [Caerostris extrusa]